jgi:hypothetical protein
LVSLGAWTERNRRLFIERNLTVALGLGQFPIAHIPEWER